MGSTFRRARIPGQRSTRHGPCRATPGSRSADLDVPMEPMRSRGRHSDSSPVRGSVAYGCGSVPDFDRLPPPEGDCVTGRPAADRTPSIGPPHPARRSTLGTVEPVSAVDAAEPSPRRAIPTFRCSPWTQAQGVDPIGSAGAFDQLLLVEWPLPWPSDVSEIDPLAAAAADPRARLMTVVPHADAADDGLRRVVHHRRTGTHRLDGVDHRVAVDAIPDLLAALLDAPRPRRCATGRPSSATRRRGARVRPRPPRSVLRAVGHAAARRAGRPWVRRARVAVQPHRRAPVRPHRHHAARRSGLGLRRRRPPRRRARPHGRRRRPWPRTTAAAPPSTRGRRSWSGRCSSSTAGRGSTATCHRRAHRGRRRRAVGHGRARVAAGRRHHGPRRGEVVVTRILPVLVCGEPPEMAKKTSPELALRRLDGSQVRGA